MEKKDSKYSKKTSAGQAVEEPVYTISAAAKLVGITVHTLRVYEREGLIICQKKPSGHRLYTKADIERLKNIREMIVVRKLSIAGIKALFALIPCWKLINCSNDDRNNCEAYQSDYWPCWTYKHENNVCTKYDCRGCEVYNTHGKIKEVRKLIKSMTSD